MRFLTQAILIVMAVLFIPVASHGQSPNGLPDLGARPTELTRWAIAAEMPEFAGFYLNGNALVVRLVGSVSREAVEEAVLAHLNEEVLFYWDREAGEVGARAITVDHSAKHSFAALVSWRNAAANELLDTCGVVSVSISYQRNSLMVGIVDKDSQRAAIDVLDRLGVPSAAVSFRHTDFPAPATLHDRHRPVRAGLQTEQWKYLGNMGLCTLGPLAYHFGTGMWGYIVPSHCTAEWFSAENSTNLYQATHASGNKIGVETVDPPGWPCGFLWLRTCRNSDAAFFRRESIGSGDYDFGRIARTMDWNGSIDIDTSNPFFNITAVGGATEGMVVDKVGRSTGWTYGTIQEECADVNLTDGIRILCAHRASFDLLAMDSGAPVFEWNYIDSARLVGMLFAKDGWFTSTEQITVDLGSIMYYWP